MNARVARRETLRQALSWRVRLKGTGGWGKDVPTILSVASNNVTSGRNRPSKLERLVTETFRGPIEWLTLGERGRGRVVDPGKKVSRIHVRGTVNAAGRLPTET
jgi:hypothetical protein